MQEHPPTDGILKTSKSHVFQKIVALPTCQDVSLPTSKWLWNSPVELFAEMSHWR